MCDIECVKRDRLWESDRVGKLRKATSLGLGCLQMRGTCMKALGFSSSISASTHGASFSKILAQMFGSQA